MCLFFDFHSHGVSITQATTLSYLNPPSKASGIAVAFFQGDGYRGFTVPKYEDVDVESLVASLFKLKSDYERELDDLKRYVHSMKSKTQV